MKDKNVEELKDHYYQLNENIFDKEYMKELIILFGYSGYYWWSRIEIGLLKNNGILKKNWKYFSMNENDKDVIEYIISLGIDNNDGTFSSYRVNKQLNERRLLSERNTKKINAYWDKQRSKTTTTTKQSNQPVNKNSNSAKILNNKQPNKSCKYCGGNIIGEKCVLCGEEISFFDE